MPTSPTPRSTHNKSTASSPIQNPRPSAMASSANGPTSIAMTPSPSTPGSILTLTRDSSGMPNKRFGNSSAPSSKKTSPSETSSTQSSSPSMEPSPITTAFPSTTHETPHSGKSNSPPALIAADFSPRPPSSSPAPMANDPRQSFAGLSSWKKSSTTPRHRHRPMSPNSMKLPISP